MKPARREALALTAPAAIVLAVVAAIPMGYVLWLSLHSQNPWRARAFIGVDNYVRLAGDERFWNALTNTVHFALVSVGVELVLGLGIAMLLAGAGRVRSVLYGAILVPWAIPTVISARVWEWMYNPQIGVLNYLIGGEMNWLGEPLAALYAVIAMDVWKSTPFVALLLLAGLQSIPPDLYRAAAIDGANAWTRFRRITLPLLSPVLLVAAVFRTIDALRVFDAIYVLTGGGPANGTETVSIYTYKTLFQALDFGYGSALAVSVLAITAVATLVYARLLRGGLQ